MRHRRILVLIHYARAVSARAQQSANPLNNWSEFLGTNMERYNRYEDVLNIHNVGKLGLTSFTPSA